MNGWPSGAAPRPQRAALPVLRACADCRKHGPPAAVVVEQAWAHDATSVLGHVAPAVVVQIAGALRVIAPSSVHPQPRRGRRARNAVASTPCLRRDVEQHVRRVAGRTPRDEVHDAAERGRAVERRSRALDDLDAAQVERRNLQQAERVSLGAVERQAIGQQLRVAASQPVHSHVGRTQRRRGRLHSQARRLGQEHRDAARRHQRLLFDLFGIDHLDAQWLIGKPRGGASGVGDDFLFEVGNRIERDVQRRRHRVGQRH